MSGVGLVAIWLALIHVWAYWERILGWLKPNRRTNPPSTITDRRSR